MQVVVVRLATTSARHVFWLAVLHSSSLICIEEIYQDINTPELMVKNIYAPRTVVLNDEDYRSVKNLKTRELTPLLEQPERRLQHSFQGPILLQHKVFFFYILFPIFIMNKKKRKIERKRERKRTQKKILIKYYFIVYNQSPIKTFIETELLPKHSVAYQFQPKPKLKIKKIEIL